MFRYNSTAALSFLDPVSVPHITEAQTDTTPKTSGICSARCWVENSDNVTLSWHRASEIIMQTSDTDVSNNLTLTLEIQRHNESIYTCRAENPVSNKTAALNSTLWCSAHDTGTLSLSLSPFNKSSKLVREGVMQLQHYSSVQTVFSSLCGTICKVTVTLSSMVRC